MREITVNRKERSISVDGQTISARWTSEAADALREFHGVDIRHEIVQALVQEIDIEVTLTEEERAVALAELTEALADYHD